MEPQDYRVIADSMGLNLTGKYNHETDHVQMGGGLGDACLRLYSLSKARGTTLEHEWGMADERDLLWPTVREFAGALAAFKQERGVMDFTDMVEQCDTSLPVDVLIIDEAQDMTLAQWNLTRRFARGVPLVIIAGDDDQSLYDWAGASSRTLRTLMGDRRILPHSHRLPRKVKAVADSIVNKIVQRVPKTFTPRDEDGSVSWVRQVEELNLRDDRSWFLLARHQYQLLKYVQECRAQGVVYKVDGRWSNEARPVRAALYYQRLLTGKTITEDDARVVASFVANMSIPSGRKFYTWEDMPWPFEERHDWMVGLSRLTSNELEYIRGLRRNDERLTKAGRVEINTIHGAKGGEADCVVLSTDITTKTLDQLRANPDPEHRVWYVGASRAKKDLVVMFPSTPNHVTM